MHNRLHGPRHSPLVVSAWKGQDAGPFGPSEKGDSASAEIIDFFRARDSLYHQRAETHTSAASGRTAVAGAQSRRETVIVQASHIREDYEIHRHIGVADSMSLHEFAGVVITCFDLGEEQAPWHFFVKDRRIDPHHTVAEYLSERDAEIGFEWGLWQFQLRCVESYPRDKETPVALCVGGSGSFEGSEFDLTAVNAALTGSETIDEVLDNVVPEVRALICDSGITDFVPLLQAIDVQREVELDSAVRERLRRLPLENEPVARQAFWACVLGLSCLSGREMTNEVLEMVMKSMGHRAADESVLGGEDIRQLCSQSLDELAACGGYGTDAVSPVELLDIYRALLRG